MTDSNGDAALLRALVGGKAAAPDAVTLEAVHTGLVLLPVEPAAERGDRASARARRTAS